MSPLTKKDSQGRISDDYADIRYITHAVRQDVVITTANTKQRNAKSATADFLMSTPKKSVSDNNKCNKVEHLMTPGTNGNIVNHSDAIMGLKAPLKLTSTEDPTEQR